eukprot:TRINITY_DN54035_c0_g1_i1.p1 TRINITY_DN54035_c0_g1~~TRINITY_DN54035_c0_g1_i1.p1  ORF type:complete len:1781 (+),score=503.89 TRINITY_DN54035_c0_g1_i1:158-5344(+)
MPPRKPVEDGEVDFHAVQTPMTTPLVFASAGKLCYTAGGSVCLMDQASGERRYLHTTAYGISRLAACPKNGLLAFCEAGAQPQVFVYSTNPVKLRYTLSDTTELELADLAFSGCGSRLYALSRATSKKLTVFSTLTGSRLKGCELQLPARFEKLSVYPEHKDRLAVVRSTAVRIVTLRKSFGTYISRVQPNSIPSDVDIAISAYSWVSSGHFLVATRQGALITLDGARGSMLYVCQAMHPITSIAEIGGYLVTAHLGQELQVWNHNATEIGQEGTVNIAGAPAMDDPLDGRPNVYTLRTTVTLEAPVGGQVAHGQQIPNTSRLTLTTAEGEVWTMNSPLEEGSVTSTDLSVEPLGWFHTHPVSDVALLGKDAKLCASADEGGRLRIWEVARSDDPAGVRTVKFTAGLTALASDPEGHHVVVGSDSGCIHVVTVEEWRVPSVLSSLRLSEAGVAQLRSVVYAERAVLFAASLFNHKVALFSCMMRDWQPRMWGILELGTSAVIEDLSFNQFDLPAGAGRAKLAVVGSCQIDGAGQPPAQIMWYFKTPALDYDPSTVEIKREVAPLSVQRLSGQAAGATVTAVASASATTMVCGFADGAVAIYNLPTQQGALNSKTGAANPVKVLAPHNQLVTCLQVSENGAWLLSGAMDGEARRSSLSGAVQDGEGQKSMHNPYNGGVLRLSGNRDCKVVASTGGADGIMVWSDPVWGVSAMGKAGPLPEVDPELVEAAVVEVDESEQKLWQPVSGAEKAAAAAVHASEDPELAAVSMAQRKALMLEIEELRKKLGMLLHQNTTCTDLERIDRREFCVDFEQRDAIAAKTKERCDELRAKLVKENHVRALMRNRLIKEFWDPMRTKGCMISSLKSSLQVSNYPERIVSAEELAKTKKLRVLRQTELLEAQMPRGAHPKLVEDVILSSDRFTTGKESYIVNWFSKKKQEGEKPPKATKADSGVEGGEGAEGGAEGAGEGAEAPQGEAAEEEAGKKKKNQKDAGPEAPTDQQYLYEPFELLTNSRRRLQVHLLQSLSAEYRAQFNKLFETCQTAKKVVLDQIHDRVGRMRSILKELKSDEEVPSPQLDDFEHKDAVLTVYDHEIKAEKFVSEEEKKKIAEAEAKEAERLRQLRENDAGTRALMQMMGGTLKTKKDMSALEIVLDKEAWMDEIPEDEMTEQQLAAYKEFQEKEKALMEEQDKYRKQLDAEFKGAKQNVEDLKNEFEAKLKELHHQRFASDARFFCQELYCVRMQLAVLQNVEDLQVAAQATAEVEASKVRLGATESELQAFQSQVDSAKAKQEERKNHEKECVSASHFKAQFAHLEQEVVALLLPIFRRKRDLSAAAASEAPADRSSNSTATTAAGHIAGVGDPYPDLDTPGAKENAALDGPIEEIPMDECPEGVDEASFRRMNELRHERLHAEAEVQRGLAVLQEMAGLLAHYQNERDDSQAEHDQILQELAEHQALMDREMFDVEVLFRLRQGQVEVPQAAVVTDYSDAIVINTEVVESRNRRIMELGKEKVTTLETIKEFRKKLSLIEWEHRMLEHQTTDLEERTKDVHMLRVTKNLQSMLKGGEEGRNKAESDLLERKIEHLSTTTQAKEASLKKQYMLGSKAAKLRKAENQMLEKKLRELQQNVIQREHIRRLRAPQGGGTGGGAKEGERPRIVGGGGRVEENEAAVRSAQAAFKEVRTRQSLLDAAKKHTEEIEVLRKELDRLRQKTFPSFVQLREERPANPDSRM